MQALKQNFFSLFVAVVMVGIGFTPGVVQADSDGGEYKDSEAVESMWGVGLRLRQIHLPESVLELFVEDAPGGGNHVGYGVELIRQKGNFAFALGFEYEDLAMTEGIYIDRGDSIPADPVDYVRFDNFSWVGVDMSFTWQFGLIGDVLSLRYGAGLGIAMIRGSILQTDYVCQNEQTDSCVQDPNAIAIDAEAPLPPVFPIVNVIVGAQIRPVKNLAINLEGGIRTVPFFGTTVALMF